ncbi:hypothetical protein ACS15_1447 [Ralstonia insidiosa]|uniref:Uncharacterized protein n=1 Tax=Ralstonia insidiosa TaxID=190721 RepID=A0AAC9BFR6_9RALS|nr:hypothetical protein ACS15_1447 [Ralstonia insidiosa]
MGRLAPARMSRGEPVPSGKGEPGLAADWIASDAARALQALHAKGDP